MFVCEQRKRRLSSRVSDDYEDIDEAERTYRGNNLPVCGVY